MKNATVLLLLLLPAIAGCQQADREIHSGPRVKHFMPSWGNSAPGLQVELPPGFHLVSDKGADFDVHRFFDSTVTGRADNRRIGIYVGHHPGLFEKEDRPRKRAEVRGTVANRGTRWACWETKERGSICEAEIRGVFAGNQGSGVSDLVIHMWVATSAPAQLAELRRLAGSLHPAREADK